MEEWVFSDYLSVIRRRKKHLMMIFAAVFIASLLFAMRYSNYRSVAQIEVSQPEVSVETTQGLTREAMVDQRISYLQQKVLSTGSLAEIIAKYDLYPSARKTKPVAELAEAMRKNIKVSMYSSALANPASAQKATAGQLAAIAFDISFDYTVPEVTQKVTNELVSRFLDEDIKQRRTQAAETSNFLASQLKVLEESLAEQEKKIAEFRSTYQSARPEALAFNQQAANALLQNVQQVESQITANIGTQGALRGQLAGMDPYARVMNEGQVLTTPSIQLRALKSDYANLTAKYGARHPDVLKVTRQIESLEKQLGDRNQSGVLRAMIADTQAKLSSIKGSHGADNPDMIALKSKLKSLEDQLAAESAKPSAAQGGAVDADNPVYLQTAAQLRAVEEQSKALTTQKASLLAQLEKHQKAIAENPVVEQQMAALTRDYENGRVRYRMLKEKKMEADMSQTIEQDRSGQRLAVINPPERPTATQPTRLIFVLGGFIAACGLSIMSILAHEILGQNVIGARHLAALTGGAAPLVCVPHLVTLDEVKTQDSAKKRALIFGGIGLAILAIIFFITVMPFDVFVEVVANKVN